MNCNTQNAITVSFIIPAYNAEKYIEVCIESVRKQTIPGWELIIVDDGSTDETSRICEQFAQLDERICVIHQENAGPAKARNNGFDRSHGQWVAFLDADDWIEEDYLERLYPYMQEQYDFIMYSYKEVYGNKTKSRCNADKDIILNKDALRLLAMDSIDTENRMNEVAPSRTQFWSKMYNRKFLAGNQIVVDASLQMCEDVMFNLRVYDKAEKGIFVSKELYNYRILDDSTCHRYCERQALRMKNLLEVMESYVHSMELDNAQLLMKKRTLASLVSICILNLCHKKNPNHYIVRKRKFLQLREEEPFCSALTPEVIRDFSLKKRICMWLVKFKCFGLLTIMLRMK